MKKAKALCLPGFPRLFRRKEAVKLAKSQSTTSNELELTTEGLTEQEPQQGTWFIVSSYIDELEYNPSAKEEWPNPYKDMLEGKWDEKYKLSASATDDEKGTKLRKFFRDCNSRVCHSWEKIYAELVQLGPMPNKIDYLIYSPLPKAAFEEMLLKGQLSKALQYSRPAWDFIIKVSIKFNHDINKAVDVAPGEPFKQVDTLEETCQKLFEEKDGLLNKHTRDESYVPIDEASQPTPTA